MKRILNKTSLIISILLIVMVVATTFVTSFSAGAKSSSQPWSFGVMGDTQWTSPTDPAGLNPNGVSASIINQLNQQFIDKGVKFVIQVGDLTENGNNADEAVRAAAARSLYDHNIGFFPMRGNHETYADPANDYAIPILQSLYPQTRGLSDTFGATNFSSPLSVSSDLNGMTYSFDYGAPGNNARFVILDDWATPSKLVSAVGYSYGYSIADQQSWINAQLDKNTRDTVQAFVFSHQPLMAENHQDSPFVGYTNSNPDMQNAFFASLQDNQVKYYISGHDHIDQRSIILSPDNNSTVQEIICASDSSKFYTPKALTDAKWYGQKSRETSIAQEMYTVGYYIYNVDGPRVTVDYYADDHGNWKSDSNYPGIEPNQVTSTLNFVRKETFGYSLNGKEFLVGGTHPNSYSTVRDTFNNTSAAILSGTYSNTSIDYNARPLTQTVDIGWTAKNDNKLSSDILTLWGMNSLGGQRNTSGTIMTDTYALSMTFAVNKSQPVGKGDFGIAVLDSEGNWVNAVDNNFGGSPNFIAGPWSSSYGLGSYGIDPTTNTAWAVINYNGSFAVAKSVKPHAVE